eukprot:scaffold17660_cov92-Amphora_coffeaeformis.AAC.1
MYCNGPSGFLTCTGVDLFSAGELSACQWSVCAGGRLVLLQTSGPHVGTSEGTGNDGTSNVRDIHYHIAAYFSGHMQFNNHARTAVRQKMAAHALSEILLVVMIRYVKASTLTLLVNTDCPPNRKPGLPLLVWHGMVVYAKGCIVAIPPYA